MILGIPLLFFMMIFMFLYFFTLSVTLRVMRKICCDTWESWGRPKVFDNTPSSSFSFSMKIVLLQFSDIDSLLVKSLFYVLAVMSYIWISILFMIFLFFFFFGVGMENILFFQV